MLAQTAARILQNADNQQMLGLGRIVDQFRAEGDD
jgi:hypothetical protein